jgi:hypothetical protein
MQSERTGITIADARLQGFLDKYKKVCARFSAYIFCNNKVSNNLIVNAFLILTYIQLRVSYQMKLDNKEVISKYVA